MLDEFGERTGYDRWKPESPEKARQRLELKSLRDEYAKLRAEVDSKPQK
jgi:hypothetical protein